MTVRTFRKGQLVDYHWLGVDRTRFLVAFLTGYIRVTALKWKMGSSIMVEC
jgi:hypothetical protein